MDERLERTARAVREAGADWAVLTSPDTVAYATGHVVPIEAGPSPFAGGPTLALVGRDGAAGLVAANVEAGAAALAWVGERVIYEGFGFEQAAPYAANYRDAVATLVRRLGAGGKVAAEPRSFPAWLSDLLPADASLDLGRSLDEARATKTPLELQALQRCAEAAARGHAAFLEALRPGRTELAVFADIRRTVEEFAGERVPFTGDFISGVERTAGFTGWPTDRRILEGDPVMADLAPRIGGYWGDSCAVTVAGQPRPGHERLFRASKDALSLAIELIRPGLAIQEFDAQIRAFVAKAGYAYPHHSGHSIGTAVHEFPRLVPYETTAFREDMVVLVEPGAYDPEIGGVRSEYMLRVTATGCVPMAPFEHVMAVAG
ncbi:M24 family metallopeptidase [Geminicoccus roseus]|uniref:M24 family metallopeptidase n=1 Tax=Geminicoccus roseus TaxID=404900 RepID=UPI0003F64ABD|nr:Xaa-Pro peptidase family protein [Geminicoccus roseus]